MMSPRTFDQKIAEPQESQGSEEGALDKLDIVKVTAEERKVLSKSQVKDYEPKELVDDYQKF